MFHRTCLRTMALVITEDHARASKQNRRGAPFLVTGGSWKKSPHKMSCTPPKNADEDEDECLRLQHAVPMASSLSNKSPSSIETSSMINTWQDTRGCVRAQHTWKSPLPRKSRRIIRTHNTVKCINNRIKSAPSL